MRFIIILLFIFSFLQLEAQVPPITPAQAQAELDKRGITEAEMRQRLLAKGVDLDKIDPTNPSEVAEAQKAIEEVLNEIDKERTQTKNDNTSGTETNGGGGNKDSGVDTSPLEDPTKIVEEQIEQKVEEKLGEATVETVEAVKESVEEGTPLEEAIAEEASEKVQEELPDSRIYGQHLFRNKSLKLYTKSEDALPPDTYVLGPGDEINISIWGLSQADFNLELQKDGYVYPSGLARIYLKGLSLERAKSVLFSRLSNYYRFRLEEFEVNVKFVRTLTINIWGEAINIGSFNIPATNTAFNALVAAGGPSDIGSVRNIQLIRANGTRKVDIYEFMTDPRVQNELYLQNNDVLYIPVSEKLVSISGAVKRPFTYELTDKENLLDLIDYAGGLTVNAYTNLIQVQRTENNEQKIIDVALQDLIDQDSDFALLNGDAVSIKVIPRPFENYVEINGAVDLPGRYALTSGMRITDLISKGVLQKEARKDIGFLLRTNDDQTASFERVNVQEILDNPNSSQNFVLQPRDQFQVYTMERYINKATVSISGDVRTPQQFPFDPDETIRVEDMVLMAGGLKQTAIETAYIKRIDPTNSTNRDYIKLDVVSALNNPSDSLNNLVLKPFDELVIYSRESFLEDYSVSISGAIRNPGEYPYDSGLRISDLIFFANGLQPTSLDFGYIHRTDPTDPTFNEYIKVENLRSLLNNPNAPENISLLPQDKFQVYSKNAITERYSLKVEGSVRNPGEYAYDPTIRISDLIILSNGLEPEATNFGYIQRTDTSNTKISQYVRVDDLYEIAQNPNHPSNITLQPEDVFRVYSRLTYTDESTVNVVGAVRTPGTFKYDPTLTLRDVLTMAGGFQLGAASSRIDVFRVVIQANTPTRTVVATLSVDDNFNLTSGGGDFTLQPYDQIAIRTVPDFELQQMVTLEGEVQFPGQYALTSKNEKLLSLINRAGGLTTEAFPEGASLTRVEDQPGVTILEMEKVLKNRSSRFNYVLKNGDVIRVPKNKELVTINLGSTLANELYPDRFTVGGKINVAHKSGKRAKWYLRKYAGGLVKNNKVNRKIVTVEHANGELRKRFFMPWPVSPKVKEGSTIAIGLKPKKIKEPKEEKEKRDPVDWEKVINNTIALAASVLTVLVLANQL